MTGRRQIAVLRRVVVAYYDVSEAQLRGRSQQHTVVAARMMLCYLARKLTSLSLSEIGAAVGRDHTTVHHAHVDIVRRLTGDVVPPGLMSEVATLTVSASAELEAARGAS